MSVLRQQRRVSLRLQRGQLNLRLLFETYTSKSLPPHTLPIAHSPLTKLYIYRAVDGRWALFLWCVYLTYGRKKKTRGFIEAQCGPLVTGRGSAEALKRFSCSAVLSFCSHTVWAFTVKSAADLRKILHTEVASKRCRVLFREADGLPW